MARKKVEKTEEKATTKKAKAEPKKEFENIENPGLKDVKKNSDVNLAEANQNINNKNLNISLNSIYMPDYDTTEERRFKEFKALTERNIQSILENIILRMFKWTLPDGIDERMLEYGFLSRGWACVFRDKEYGELGLPAMPCFFNLNGNPTYANVYGFGGFYKAVACKYYKDDKLKSIVNVDEIQANSVDGVIARDNDYGINNTPKRYIEIVKEYTYILSDLKIGMLNSAQRLKQPFIVAVKKRALKKSANAIINSIKNNKPTIILLDDKITETKSVRDYIEFIDLKGDSESPKKLQELYENQFNLFLSTIGINTNPSPDKTQYVNSPEINSNNEFLQIASDVRFHNRKKLCERAKEVLNIEMNVEINKDEDKQLQQLIEKGRKIEDETLGASSNPE